MLPNVWTDLCWVYIISPAVGRSALGELLETVPANKILGFGGDCSTVEATYAHAVMARKAIARTLSEKVVDGLLDEETAVYIARRILRDNVIDCYGLGLPVTGS
jgi:hypothetical protein